MGIKQKSRVLILITPYHVKQLLLLAEELKLNQTQNHIIYSSFIKSEEVDEIPSVTVCRYEASQLQLLPVSIFQRVVSVFMNPRAAISKYRRVVEFNRNLIENFTKQIVSDNVELIIFNDRDFLTQLLILYLQDGGRRTKVIAIDEGLGYYIKEGIREHLLKHLYKITSRLVVGFDYKFIEQYGTHPAINEVYLRYPELVKDRLSSAVYKKILNRDIKQIQNKFNGKTVLLFSTLLSELNFISNREEYEFYEKFSDILKRNGVHLVWKPHPRESLAKIEIIQNLLNERGFTDIWTLDSYANAEVIDYQTFDYIINFGSTVMLDVLGSGFNAKRILTIRLNNFGIVNHIFESTNIVRIGNFERGLNRMISENEA